LNGENYRIVSSKTVEGNHVNEQALIQEALGNNGYGYNAGYGRRQGRQQGQQQGQYSDSNYAQVRSGNRNDQYYPNYDGYNDDSSS